MKHLISILGLLFTVSIFSYSQFSISGTYSSYLGPVNEAELPEYDEIEMRPGTGFKIGLDLSESEDESFDLFYQYTKSNIYYPDNGKTYGFATSKLGFETTWYSDVSAFYGGLGLNLAWSKEEVETMTYKGWGSFGKIGFGEKTESFFIEAGLDLLSVGSEMFTTPKGEMRLQLSNFYISLGYRF
jgi:hypothetical protein